MVNKNSIIFDENLYPIAWRFNSDDCSLSDKEKKEIFFIMNEESKKLWDLLFPFNNLMDIGRDFFFLKEKKELDFDDENEALSFFEEKLKGVSYLIFFWGRCNCAIVPPYIFLKSWSDFFYPSDENCIAYLVNKSEVIFSYEETFFYGSIVND